MSHNYSILNLLLRTKALVIYTRSEHMTSAMFFDTSYHKGITGKEFSLVSVLKFRKTLQTGNEYLLYWSTLLFGDF